MPKSKDELELEELQLKIDDLKRPLYKKFPFWTGIASVVLAVVGILGQSYISQIRAERARLDVEKAHREMSLVIQRRDSLNNQIDTLRKRKEEVLKELATATSERAAILDAYAAVYEELAFRDSSRDARAIKTKSVAVKTSSNISEILATEEGSNILMKSIRVRVYYLPATKEKAIKIDELLRQQGARSSYGVPEGYDISKVQDNEIVYYNEPQLVYCEAVKKLLEKNGYTQFKIRRSTKANDVTKFFKIYVVE